MFHLQFYTRPPKGKHAGPHLLTAATSLHIWRVTITAARARGLIDRGCLHDDYALRDLLFDLGHELGFTGDNVLLPNHVRSRKVEHVVRCGDHYAMRAMTDNALMTEDQLVDDDRRRSLPSDTATAVVSHRPSVPGQARRSQLNGPGAAGGPASAGTATATDELRTAAANISTAEYVLMCASPEFREVTSKYRRDHGWFKIRFAPNANDINWILSDEVCVADFMMLLRCAFRYRGLLLTSSQAKAFVPYYKHRQLTRIKMCKRRLDDTFNRIVSWARFDPSQMIDPSGQGGGGGPAQPVPAPPQPTPAPPPPPPPLQRPPRARPNPLSEEEQVQKHRTQSRESWRRLHGKQAKVAAVAAAAAPLAPVAAAPAPAPAPALEENLIREARRKRKNEQQQVRDQRRRLETAAAAAAQTAVASNPLFALAAAAAAAPDGPALADSVDAQQPDTAGPPADDDVR